MEHEVHETGPLQDFIASLYSGAFYDVAPGLGLGAGFRNLLILVMLLGFIGGIRSALSVGTFMQGWQAGVEEGRIPAVYFEAGRLRVVGPQPYVWSGPNGLMAIVDTTGHHATLPDSALIGVFLGPRSGFMRVGDSVRPIAYVRDPTQSHLDGPGLAGLRDSVMLAAAIALWGAGFFYLFFGNALLAFLLAGPGYWFGRRWRPDLRYSQVLTLACFVLTPVALLFLTVGLVEPPAALWLAPFYPMLTAWLLMTRLRRWIVPRLTPGPPA